MDRFKDDMRFSDSRVNRERTNKNPLDIKEEYHQLGKELLLSAISLENSLSELIASEANRVNAMVSNSRSCSQSERTKILSSNDSFKKTISNSSIIEIAVLSKILIACATMHHEKILSMLLLIKDKFDIDDLDFKKIVLFFKNQDWNNLIKSVMDFLKNNLELIL